jgi:hypothetical protein
MTKSARSAAVSEHPLGTFDQTSACSGNGEHVVDELRGTMRIFGDDAPPGAFLRHFSPQKRR